MKIGEFWTWFQHNASRYYNLEEHNPQELFSALSYKLCEIHPDISFEFSSILEDKRREFVITANGMHAAFPYVKKLVDQAPHMDDWKIIAFRQRKPGFEYVTIGNFKLDATSIHFEYDLQPDKVDVILFIDGYNGEPIYRNAIFLILDRLLGEYDVETKLGEINFENENHMPDTALVLVDLAMIIDEYFKRK